MGDLEEPEEEIEEQECRKSRVRTMVDRIEHHWIEIVAAALLALATIMSASSAYQSAGWSGRSEEAFSSSSRAMVSSSEFLDKAYQEGIIDALVFTNYTNALAAGDIALANVYRARGFSTQLEKAYEAFIRVNPDGKASSPHTPFEMPEYTSANRARAKARMAASAMYSSRGRKATDNANSFVLLTVLFAAVLFFAGISTKFQAKLIKIVVLGMGIAMFTMSVVLFALQSYY